MRHVPPAAYPAAGLGIPGNHVVVEAKNIDDGDISEDPTQDPHRFTGCYSSTLTLESELRLTPLR